MSYVHFATICDHCGAHSEEYTAWPECAGCLNDICPACYAPGSLVAGDGERRDRVMCHMCQLEATA